MCDATGPPRGTRRLDNRGEPSLGLAHIGNPQQQERCLVELAVTRPNDALNVVIFADGLSHDTSYISDSHWRISESVMVLRFSPCLMRAFRAMSTSVNPG